MGIRERAGVGIGKDWEKAKPFYIGLWIESSKASEKEGGFLNTIWTSGNSVIPIDQKGMCQKQNKTKTKTEWTKIVDSAL